MEPTSEVRRASRVGVWNLLVLFLLPLIALALLDIHRGEEDLVLEWSVVGVGLMAIGIIQVATLVILWRERRR